jgi:hypothetical protein
MHIRGRPWLSLSSRELCRMIQALAWIGLVETHHHRALLSRVPDQQPNTDLRWLKYLGLVVVMALACFAEGALVVQAPFP